MEWLISNVSREQGKGGVRGNTQIDIQAPEESVGESLEGFTLNPEFLDQIGASSSPGFPKR
jgi:hypothetical protein